MQKTLVEIYQKIKSGEYNTEDKTNKFINDCFKYGLLRENPDEDDKKVFSYVFRCEYPHYLSEIPEASKEIMEDKINNLKEDEKIGKWHRLWKRQRYEKGYSDTDFNNIRGWFINILPKMLQEMSDNLCSVPPEFRRKYKPAAASKTISEDIHKNLSYEEWKETTPGFTEWKETIDRMTFLLKEMNGETCAIENPYADELDKIRSAFYKEYGGEGDMFELYPTAKDMYYNSVICEMDINMYLKECQEEFFSLFFRYFDDLKC